MSVLALPSPWTDAIVLGALSFAGVIAGFRRSPWCLVLLVAGMVFSAFYVSVGTKWSGQEVLPLAILLGLFVRESIPGRQDRILTFPRPLVAVVIGLGLFAGLSSWFAPENPPGGPSGFQLPSLRPFVQAASYGLTILYFLIPLWIGTSRHSLKITSRSLVTTAAATAMYGLYQLAAYSNGLPFRRIQYSAEQEGVGLINVQGTTLFRMSGLSNEPKQLAVICVVGLVVALVAKRMFKRSVTRYVAIWLCGVGLIGALSTGGYLAALVVAGAGGIWLMWSAGGPRRRALQGVLMCGVLLVGIVAHSGQTIPFSTVARTIAFERVNIPGVIETVGASPRIENDVFSRFVEHPHELVTGLGLGNYPYVVGEHGEWVWSGGIQPMHSMYLTLLADFGFLALLVLGLGLRATLRGSSWLKFNGLMRRTKREQAEYGAVVAGLVASLFVSMFVSLLPLVLLFMGLLYSHHRQRRFELELEGLNSGPRL